MINAKNLERARWMYELSDDADMKNWITYLSHNLGGEVIGRTDRLNFFREHPKLNNCMAYHKIDGTIWWDFSNSAWFDASSQEIDDINSQLERDELLDILLSGVE